MEKYCCPWSGRRLGDITPLSQLASEKALGLPRFSARNPDVVMSRDLFESYDADVIEVVDTDGSSEVSNVEKIIHDLISAGKADAFLPVGPIGC